MSVYQQDMEMEIDGEVTLLKKNTPVRTRPVGYRGGRAPNVCDHMKVELLQKYVLNVPDPLKRDLGPTARAEVRKQIRSIISKVTLHTDDGTEYPLNTWSEDALARNMVQMGLKGKLGGGGLLTYVDMVMGKIKPHSIETTRCKVEDIIFFARQHIVCSATRQ